MKTKSNKKPFGTLINEFKLNSNKKVMKENKDIIFPDTDDWQKRNTSVSFTEEDLKKLTTLKLKYKITRSAIIRILLNGVDV